MKKVFNSLFVIIAAMVTFAGCAKQEIDAPATPETKTVQFFANSIETKTVFGEPDKDGVYPTLWTKDDRVKVHLNLESIGGTEKSVDVTLIEPIDDKSKKATFKADISDVDAESYTFYAVSPAIAWKERNQDGVIVDIPSTQIPLENSVDEKAQVIYAVSENYVLPQMPTNVDLDFKHFSAYCKLSFSKLSEELGNISKVTLESEVDLAGKLYLNVGEGEPTVTEGSKKITITTDKSENIWIACAPADVRGKKIKFIIDAMDGSSVSREVTFPSEEKYQFKSGYIANLTIDMSKGVLEKPTVDKCFEKVTSAPSDWTGTYLIVYEGGKVAFDGSLATLDAAGNTISVTITDNKIVYSETLMKSTFAISKNGDSYSIKSASGKYIGNNSNSNSLTSSNSALNNSLSFKSENEIDVISSGGAYLRYNATSGQNRFRYFKSGTYTGQKAIQLYKLVESSEGGETPELEELNPTVIECVEATETTLSFQWGAVANASGYKVEFNGETRNQDETAYLAENLASGKEYTIKVTALGDGVNYSDSEVSECVAATQEIEGGGNEPEEPTEITVAEFLAAEVDENVYYTLKGTITNVANTSYGNFDLTDDTGTVYIYGLLSEDGATNKYWATSGAKLGDDIVISVTRGVYNGTAQGANARFIELISPGTRAFYTLDNEAIDFASDGGEKTVTVTPYNSEATVTATSDNDTFKVAVDGYTVTISSDANELEEKVEGTVTIKLGDLEAKTVKVSLAAKPASGVVEGGSDDFHTITSTNTSYVSGKTTAGWEYKNCAIFKGGTSDASPAFKMIGDASNRALCMNGKTSAVGTITSPTLTTGCGTLKFNYGLPFGDTKIKFRVDIMQNGSVVKTFTVNPSNVTKLTKYTHEESINVSGNFQIVFTNLSPSNSTSNKDRTAIWDVEWTGCK